MNLKEKIVVGLAGLGLLFVGYSIGNTLHKGNLEDKYFQGLHEGFSRGAASMAVGAINFQDNTNYSWKEVDNIENIATCKTYKEIRDYSINSK